MLYSEYQGIYQRLLKRALMRTYESMGVITDDRATKTIIFDPGVRKYSRVTEIMIFDQVYVTDYNCN